MLNKNNSLEKQLYILTAIIVLFFACNSKTDRSRSTSRLPEPDLVQRLEYQKAAIDTLYDHSKEKIIVFAKLADNDELVPITNEDFPENVETSFSILKDSSGKLITTSEIPVSQSGDWYIVLTHYFDKNGQTFAFERQTNFFNGICTGGVAYETKTEFYDDNFELVSSQYKLVDAKNQPLNKDSCGHAYNFDYKVSSNADHYLHAKKIKKDR